MSDYSQPDFYRFTEDSLALVNYVRERITSCRRLADLGAGCGVIGLELATHFRPDYVELVEAQEEFLPHLLANSKDAVITVKRFSDWKPRESFDVIVSNPPYFLPGHGRSSPTTQRHHCRTFEWDGWKGLLTAIENALSPEGRAFVMIPNDARILSVLGMTLDEDRNHQLAHLLVLEMTKETFGLRLQDFVLR